MSEARFPWRTLLLVSVALNLLVVGGLVGAWSAGVRVERDRGDAVAVTDAAAPGAFLRALPPEARDAMREELASSWSESRDTRQAAVQARRDAFAAAAQEPYDAARVRAAFERLRSADQAAIGVFQDNIIDRLGALSPEQRREALSALRRAAPALRRDGVEPLSDRGSRVVDPERREQIQERRERWRERREERSRRQQPEGARP